MSDAHKISIKANSSNTNSRLIAKDFSIFVDDKEITSWRSLKLEVGMGQALVVTIEMLVHEIEIEGNVEPYLVKCKECHGSGVLKRPGDVADFHYICQRCIGRGEHSETWLQASFRKLRGEL